MRENAKVKLIPAHKKETHLIDAGIYVRVSTARAEQLRSLSSQVSAMTRYIYSRENWILKDIYLEVGSAKTGSSRREFTRLLDDCNSQQIEVVVVKSLSRFGRDNVEVIESIRALVSAGVTIYFMEEDIDVDASYPEWELSLRSAVNQSENEHRSENIKMGLRFRAESGESGLYRKPSFEYIIRTMYKETGNIEASFSSKMIATIDANMPIWDRYVMQNLCLELKGKTKEDQLDCAVGLYDQMVAWYGDFLKTENGRDCIAEFDKTLPGYTWMSDVKKIDFYLWSIRV